MLSVRICFVFVLCVRAEVLVTLAAVFRAQTLTGGAAQHGETTPTRLSRAASGSQLDISGASESQSRFGGRTLSIGTIAENAVLRSAPVTPTRNANSVPTPAVGMSFASPIQASPGDAAVSAGTNGGDDGMNNGSAVSPLPIPDPKLWRGPMLDTSAARVSRTSSRLMGLSVDFTAEGMSPLAESPLPSSSSQGGTARSASSRRPKSREVGSTGDVVTVSETNIDEILLSVDPTPGTTHPTSPPTNVRAAVSTLLSRFVRLVVWF